MSVFTKKNCFLLKVPGFSSFPLASVEAIIFSFNFNIIAHKYRYELWIIWEVLLYKANKLTLCLGVIWVNKTTYPATGEGGCTHSCAPCPPGLVVTPLSSWNPGAYLAQTPSSYRHSLMVRYLHLLVVYLFLFHSRNIMLLVGAIERYALQTRNQKFLNFILCIIN